MSITRPPKKPTLGLETLAEVLGTAPQSLPTPEPENTLAYHDRLAEAASDEPVGAPITGTTKLAPEPTAWKVITVRLGLDDYRWLRQQAHEASMQTGHRADASALLRRLVAEARSRQR
jgi:hypothetical protein